MPEAVVTIHEFRLIYRCDECKTGIMEFRITMTANESKKQHMHRCTECGVWQILDKQYPVVKKQTQTDLGNGTIKTDFS